MKLEQNFKCYYNCSKLPKVTDDAKSLINQIAKENSLKVASFKNISEKSKNNNQLNYAKLLLTGPRENFKYLYIDSNWQKFFNNYNAILNQTIPYGKLVDFN